MSAFVSKQIAFKRKHIESLVAALEAHYGKGNVEVHETPQNLYGYQGDMRAQKANVIVRRQHVGSAANDIGWEFKDDGTCVAHISEYDRGATCQQHLQDKFAQGYAEKVVKKAATKFGWKLQSETKTGGAIKLKMQRRKW